MELAGDSRCRKVVCEHRRDVRSCKSGNSVYITVHRCPANGLVTEVKAWQTRRLDAVLPILFLDGIVVHIRGESGQVREHTMYVAIGVTFSGKKDLLGLWLDETEGAKI